MCAMLPNKSSMAIKMQHQVFWKRCERLRSKCYSRRSSGKKESRPDPMSSSDPIRKNNRPHTKRHAIKHQTNHNRTARKLWTTLNAIHNGETTAPQTFYYTNRNCIVTADQAGPVSISPFFTPICFFVPPNTKWGKDKVSKRKTQ